MKKFIKVFVILLFPFAMSANNVVTNNISISGQNITNHSSQINYDISWDNSWRTSTNENNYDGVWIFIKFRKVNTYNWEHATINYASPGTAAACGHTQAGGSTIQTAQDGKGIWMYRAANGQGTVNWTANSLRWNYGVDGVQDNDSVEIRLFSVEMVKVNVGAFNLGSGGNESYHFRDGAVDTYFPITTDSTIIIGTNPGELNVYTGAYPQLSLYYDSIPAAFPTGYNAFWIMKYEFSHLQYSDFLNTIDAAHAASFAIHVTGTHPNYITANPTQALYFTKYTDIMAWLDWAAMRPFTEMEYEKACRGGGQLPIANEYPWGTTAAAQIDSANNRNLSNETWNIGNASYGFNITTEQNVMRCGALATPTSTRSSSGASYYGVMELGGNVGDLCVAVTATQFNGSHGDGYLGVNGADAPTWTTIPYTGFLPRGGGYSSVISEMQTSFRGYVNPYTNRHQQFGGRGARTAE